MTRWLHPLRWLRLGAFVLYYAWEVARSSVRVARDVLARHPAINPAFVEVRLRNDWSDNGLLILANLISMTPGTLTVDVSPDRRALRLHVLYGDDPRALREVVIPSFEERLARVLA